MIRHMNGDVEGTPEELAAYDAARQRLLNQENVLSPRIEPRLEPLDDLVHRTAGSTGRRQSSCPACAKSGVCGCVLAGSAVIS